MQIWQFFQKMGFDNVTILASIVKGHFRAFFELGESQHLNVT
jgi:hypothetical protein